MFIISTCVYCYIVQVYANNDIAKSKSTNDVLKTKEMLASAKPPPPINLLAAQRRPLEIHKIEGDRILIIRRVPKSRRVADMDQKHGSLSSIPINATNKVKALSMQCPNTKSNNHFNSHKICAFQMSIVFSVHTYTINQLTVQIL